MSAGASGLSRPTRPGKATLKLSKDSDVSKGSVPNTPTERSPRQCIAPPLTSPRMVCVVIGPFMGWKSVTMPLPLMGDGAVNDAMSRLMVMGLVVTTSSGLPRSQAEAVEIAEDVAARAGGLAVGGRELRVVEEGASVDDAGRLGIVHGHVRDLAARGQIDGRDGVVEASQHIQAIARLVEREAAGAAGRKRDVVGAADVGVVGIPGAVAVEHGGIEHADLGGSESGHVQLRPFGDDDHLHRRRQAVRLHGRRAPAARCSRCACSGGAP